LETQLADLRNPGAHSSRISRQEARKVRDRLIGIGCKGEFVELAGTLIKGKAT
jgi:hypothetical protein